jgi:hypothetical protein
MMARKVSVLLICSILLIAGCRKDPDIASIRPGQLQFTLVHSTSLDVFYQTINAHDLQVHAAYGFAYAIDTTVVSFATLVDSLRTKPYLTNGGRTFGIHPFGSMPYASIHFFDLDDTDYVDWNETILEMGLVELAEVSPTWKRGSISVPIGEEYRWMNTLRGYAIFRWVNLN